MHTSHSFFPLTRSCVFVAVTAVLAPAMAQGVPEFTSEQIVAGAKIFEENCSACHGARMAQPLSGTFDLRNFPADQRARFVKSVSDGRNQMPPWKSLLSQEDIGKLFAYVVAGEKKK